MTPPSQSPPARRGVAALAVAATVVAGLWLHAPSLGAGFYLDDYQQLAELDGHDVLPGSAPFSLYTFAEPIPDRLGPVQGDDLPWWSDADVELDFLRPIPSLLLRVDHALFGADPVGFHAVTLLWSAALLAAVARLFVVLGRAGGRGPWVAVLAGVVFALDSASWENVAWIAARYTLVAGVFGVLALLAYHRWRSGAGKSVAPALAWLVLALLSAEASVGIAGFCVAYELSLGTGPPRRRLRALAPVAAVVLIYAVAYVASGHGAQGSALYVDPLAESGSATAAALGGRLARTVRRLLLPAAAMPWGTGRLLRAVGVEDFDAVLATVTALAWTAFAVLALQSRRDRVSRFLFVGAILALLPTAASSVSERVMVLSIAGISWLYAAVAADALRDVRRGGAGLPWAVLRALVAAGLLGLHLAFDPPLARYSIAQRSLESRTQVENARAAELPAAGAERARVVLLTSPDSTQALSLPFLRLHLGFEPPAAVWPVSFLAGAHRLTRTGESSFRLERGWPGLLDEWWIRVYRADPFVAAGSRHAQGAMVVTAEEVAADGAVLAVEVEIDRPLDDPDVWLVAWDGAGWTRRAAPAVGESVDLVPSEGR